MRIKSAAEIELIRESGKWCAVAHRLLQQYSVPGATEAEASLRAGHEATLEMLATLGDAFGGQQASSDGATAGYRGQIGKRSAWAHAVAHNIEFKAGDVLVTETSAPIWGYNAELERAMIIGEPTDEMRRLFDHTVAAQDVAFAALRPGVTCADVDGAVLKYFEDNDLLPYWRQHVGHGIGLRNHESPFLDIGDRTVVEAGHGVHDRAGALRLDGRRLPSLGHRCGDRGRDRNADRLSARHRTTGYPRVGPRPQRLPISGQAATQRRVSRASGLGETQIADSAAVADCDRSSDRPDIFGAGHDRDRVQCLSGRCLQS